MKFKLGVKTSIDIAHRLERYAGKCNRLHGHTFIVEVEVEGTQLDEHNMVIDLVVLKQIVKEVLGKYNHSFLNESLSTEQPTSEFFLMNIGEQIKDRLKPFNVRLSRIRVYETPETWVEIGD